MENKRKIEEKHNNRKALVMVIAILLVFMLIGGTTYAFFLFSAGTGDVDVQSTPDISLTYSDNDTSMKKDLIPTSRTNALKGLLKETDKCVDIYGFSACSLYEFTITNNSDAAQVINVTMTPLENGYQNLEFMLYSGKIEDITENTVPIISNQQLDYNSLTPITFNSLTETILANDDVSYTLVFYLYDTGENQTKEDSDKTFRANVNINSITTGQYISEEING